MWRCCMCGCGDLECLSKPFVKTEVDRREKILGYVMRGLESDRGVSVEVTLEVGVPE